MEYIFCISTTFCLGLFQSSKQIRSLLVWPRGQTCHTFEFGETEVAADMVILCSCDSHCWIPVISLEITTMHGSSANGPQCTRDLSKFGNPSSFCFHIFIITLDSQYSKYGEQTHNITLAQQQKCRMLPTAYLLKKSEPGCEQCPRTFIYSTKVGEILQQTSGKRPKPFPNDGAVLYLQMLL